MTGLPLRMPWDSAIHAGKDHLASHPGATRVKLGHAHLLPRRGRSRLPWTLPLLHRHETATGDCTEAHETHTHTRANAHTMRPRGPSPQLLSAPQSAGDHTCPGQQGPQSRHTCPRHGGAHRAARRALLSPAPVHPRKGPLVPPLTCTVPGLPTSPAGCLGRDHYLCPPYGLAHVTRAA